MTQNDTVTHVADTIGSAHGAATRSISDSTQVAGEAQAVSNNGALENGAQASSGSLPIQTDSTAQAPRATLNVDSLLNTQHFPLSRWSDTLTTHHTTASIRYGETIPYNAFNDNWVSGSLLTSFLLLVVIFVWSRKYLSQQLRNFFMPTNNENNQSTTVKTPVETYSPLLMALLLCYNSGILLYAFASQQYDLTTGMYPHILVLGVCIGSFMAYYLLRWMLYRFTNWVFFENSEKRTWNVGFSFLTMLESILLLPIVLYVLNARWDIQNTTIFILCAFVITRILLLFHSFRIFFPKIYGILHLFAYLCTLELIPLLCLWKFLSLFSAELMVK